MSAINSGVLDGTRRVEPGVRGLGINAALAGAPLGMRLRGATQAGPPTVGSWKAGDHVEDRAAGAIWIATANGAGLAANWVQSGSLVQTASVTSAYTALATDSVILASAASASVTVTLPTAVGAAGKSYTVKKTDATINTVIIATTGGQLIDGAASYVMNLGWSLMTVVSNGSNWLVLEKPVIDVKSFGAIGNGIADDTAAIQAAINAITGSAAPASNTRAPSAALLFPGGIYKVSSDLIIRSVSNFKMIGAGPAQTQIRAAGTGFMQAVLFIDGSEDGVFEGFEVTGDGTEQVYDGIRLDWVTTSRTDGGCVTNGTTTVANTLAQAYDAGATVTGTGIGSAGTATVVTATPGVGWTVTPACSGSATVSVTVASLYAAARSTTGNCFRDIRVRNLKFVTGMSLEGNGAQQIDGTTLENVIVTGGQTTSTWSSSGNWQTGFALGNGTYGNNYDHRAVGCDANDCYYGWKINASSVGLTGSQPADNFYDFYVEPSAQCTFTNIQSQNCNQFLTTPNAYNPIPVSFEDVLVKTLFLNSGNVLCSVTGGMWHFKNFNAAGLQTGGGGAYLAGLWNLAGSQQSPVRTATFSFDNLAMNGARTSCIVPGSGNPLNISVRNYVNFAPSTGAFTPPVAGDLLSLFAQISGTTGAWLNQDQVAVTPPQINFYTASSNTWTKAAGAQTVQVVLAADGGGGGSGAFAASGNAGGGAAGGGGGYASASFQASQLSGSVTVAVGQGGAEGGAVTSAGAGAAGSSGSGSSFGSYLWAHGGLNGNGGNATNAAASNAGAGGGGQIGGGAGGGAVTSAAAGSAGVGTYTTGGGGGGGVTAGPTAQNGGGTSYNYLSNSSNAASGGVVGGASPTNGPAFIQGNTGAGGGGGAAALSGAAQSGASAQAQSGGGGGGGGACSGGTTSGAGGQGGSGWVMVTTYFQ